MWIHHKPVHILARKCKKDTKIPLWQVHCGSMPRWETVGDVKSQLREQAGARANDRKGELKQRYKWNCFNCSSLLHTRQDDEGRWSPFAAIWSLALAAARAAVSYSLCSPPVILALTSKTLLKPCIVMRASQERGRLAGEGHAKFTDKGQFRKKRRRGEETERAEAEKVEKCDLSPPSTWWNIPRHQ